ncbi:CPS_HP_G0138880.mRNA.1.CDS.1 [Saccharomyces cerevisiae]|nr:CPS_HP_G0046110.mRNA.1.CDS.1 [Saccharomyces cerevisiae]CAI4995014.1 CPS_HP_G0071190.mRNA.1.CDS.1 [Saccharomyces cerevisiae]CAI5137866.1 CPS_HP_G0138880.mRNA.1.CDS.1 [Saccharomyces cerevisiae]CAI6684127.1 CPS_HP_G0046110.mRNA.1.CDS.1 [Saccharomyces cerevisiae]CAI6880613.1 CPS_HP_G0071190.mRNA.1.CDS.1 [Saccharomyces cerevisiae]
MSLEAIVFDRSEPENVSVKVLDQLLLPYTTKYVPIHTIDDGYSVIKSMQVRGAPAIAIVGSLSVLTEVQLIKHNPTSDVATLYSLVNWESTKTVLNKRLDFLLSSRPTAVNLSNSLVEIKNILKSSSDLKAFDGSLYNYVCELIDEDLANNMKMGDNGAKYLIDVLQKDGFKDEFAVLTICNTGSLATSGYGTALGVIRSLWKDSLAKTDKADSGLDNEKCPRMGHVFPLETRPYNQGSRLTAYELVYDKIPSTLITDSSIAYRIRTSSIPIKAAFVGADRIVRNGDTANKIGTLQLAVICKQFGIKFFVVAPKTTIDNVTETGDDIIVEERNPEEFKVVTGTVINPENGSLILNESGEPITGKVGIAPLEINVWNPAFDITPHELIDGIITEEGVFTKSSSGEFQLESLF